jgi:hypothetical protein
VNQIACSTSAPNAEATWGRPMMTILESIPAIKIPTVVTVRTTHWYFILKTSKMFIHLKQKTIKQNLLFGKVTFSLSLSEKALARTFDAESLYSKLPVLCPCNEPGTRDSGILTE